MESETIESEHLETQIASLEAPCIVRSSLPNAESGALLQKTLLMAYQLLSRTNMVNCSDSLKMRSEVTQHEQPCPNNLYRCLSVVQRGQRFQIAINLRPHQNGRRQLEFNPCQSLWNMARIIHTTDLILTIRMNPLEMRSYMILLVSAK